MEPKAQECYPTQSLLSAALYNSLLEMRRKSEEEYGAQFDPVPDYLNMKEVTFENRINGKPVCLISATCVVVDALLPLGSVVVAPMVRMLRMPPLPIFLDANLLVMYHGKPSSGVVYGQSVCSNYARVFLLGTEVPMGQFQKASVVRLPEVRHQPPHGAYVAEESFPGTWHLAAMDAVTIGEFREFLESQANCNPDNIWLDLNTYTRNYREECWVSDPASLAYESTCFPATTPLEIIPSLRALAAMPLVDRKALFSNRTPYDCAHIIRRILFEGYLTLHNPPRCNPAVVQAYESERAKAEKQSI